MRVVIAGGRSRTDFLVESLVAGGNDVVIVNNDRAWCEHLAARHDVPVVCGDATKRYVLDDADNLVICQMAQFYFGIERQVCTAYNPRNVAVFKKLGISSVVSATFVLSKLIEEASFAALGSTGGRAGERRADRARAAVFEHAGHDESLDATAGLRRVLSEGLQAADDGATDGDGEGHA